MEEIRKDILNETDEKEVYQYANTQKSSHSINERYLSRNNLKYINGILVSLMNQDILSYNINTFFLQQ